MATRSKRSLRTRVINTDMDRARELLERAKLDKIVFTETVAGKAYTIVEIERKLGPLGADDNNNNLC